MLAKVRAIVPAPTPLRVTLTLHGTLVETEEAENAEAAMWASVWVWLSNGVGAAQTVDAI
jgi:hypothetical protein